MTIVYVRTTDPDRLVAVPVLAEEPVAIVATVGTNLGPHDWCYANPLGPAAMQEAQQVAAAAGLRLRQPEQVAVR